MKQKFIGTFPLGHHNVDLYVLPDENNGYFYVWPDENSLPRIKVGIRSEHWDEVVNILLHEAFEMAMAILRCRYEKTNVKGDHASYMFLFDHCQLVDLCESVAQFISPAMPKLAEVYNKLHKIKK